MKSFLKKLLLGIRLPQEYVTTSQGGISGGLRCFLHINGVDTDITDNLLFLGYKPLLIGFAGDPEVLHFIEKQTSIRIDFKLNTSSSNVAQLTLKSERQFDTAGKRLLILSGISGTQKFESSFHQFMFSIYDRFRSKPKNNIDLYPDLYNQVKIAYSIPREIKLITVEKNNLFNIFPTDLHGSLGNGFYVISLRNDKNAGKQLEESGKIALWRMDAHESKEVYLLGKNHSKELRPVAEFNFTSERSKKFNLPEPHGSLSSEELQLEKILGDFEVHRLYLFRTIGTQTPDNDQKLVHLHRSYVQWHLDKGLRFEGINH